MSDEQQYPYPEQAEGCWFDNCRGANDIGQAVIDEAIRKGFNQENTGRGGQSRMTPDDEFFFDEVDRAEQYLNQFAPEGFWIGYHPDWGDFGMYRIEQEDDGGESEVD